MNNIQTNITDFEAAKLAVIDHCMCAKFIEEKDRYIVLFPAGFQADGAQMRFCYQNVSKTKALKLLINTMEKYWSLQ